MKYIMLQHRETKQKVPIIFPNFMVHSLIAASLRDDPLFGFNYDVVSAGDCTITCSSVSGDSKTLGLTFADGDSEVIDMILHGL